MSTRQLLPAERLQRIGELLLEHKALRVSQLSQMIGVSEVTVRRDLGELDERGVIERTHGGAILMERLHEEPTYNVASITHGEAKRSVGRAAARLLSASDSVFFSAGTTTLEVFRSLEHPIRVITNHLGIAVEAREQHSDVVVPGGTVRPRSNALVGSLTTRVLSDIYCDKAIISGDGLSVRDGLTVPSIADAEVLRLMIQQTRGKVIAVADSSKIGRVADYGVCRLDVIDYLVVDSGISDDLAAAFEDGGVQVVVGD